VNNQPDKYDALVVVSFGGPEGREDVLPFLENVLRGKRVPRERMLEVAEHYYHFDGVSPINAQNRALLAALEDEFRRHQMNLPIYWGNRNWHPYLADTVLKMKEDDVRHALAFVTSVFGSYSGCRQYQEDLQRARETVGTDAPLIDKLRSGFNHPGFISAMSERVKSALDKITRDCLPRTQLVFTAHSIPTGMAAGSPYVTQLSEACRLVAEAVGQPSWKLVYQSRSGPPQQPWLEPDICDYLREIASQDLASHVVVAPIGFISDHMEVLFDLDTEARQVSEEVGLTMVRAETVGTHPQFISMIRELVIERLDDESERRCLGVLGPSPDICPGDCCPSGQPRPTA
jgi:ferrochelatase